MTSWQKTRKTRMERKKKKCIECENLRYIFSKGRCQYCSEKSYALNAKRRKGYKTKKRKTTRKTINRKRRVTVTSVKKKVDAAFSQYIRLRDSDKEGYCTCITCGYVGFWKADKIQCGHFRSRRYNSTRYHPKNNHPQCSKCNVLQSGEQYLYGKRVDEFYGDGYADTLVELSQETKKFTVAELQEMLEDYKEKVKELLKEKGL